MSRVIIVGQGYVGLPLAIRATEAGHEVIGFEVDPAKATALNEGRSHVEDISDERLSASIATGRYRATTEEADLDGFDVAVISVPTPLTEGLPDLSFMEQAAAVVGAHLAQGATVVLESTTYPGTTEELIGPILAEASGLEMGAGFHLGYSPERIDPGNQTWRLENTPKVVAGIDPASLEKVQAFYDSVVDTTVPVSGTREAELTKLLENTFRHVNIALVNELAMFSHDLGINIWEAIDAASTKPFGYMRFTPGPGVGGHCLPVDPSYLSWQVKRSLGRTFRFVELANDVNQHMPAYVVDRLIATLNRRKMAVNGSKLLLLGLAYKSNTGDARESPSVPLAEHVITLGAELRIADPHVHDRYLPEGSTRVAFDAEQIAWADTIILAMDHSAFDFDLLVGSDAHVLDCRNKLDGPNIERL